MSAVPTVTMQPVQEPVRATQRTCRVPPIERSTRILVVEDEPLTAEVFARALARDGHAVEVARDGLQALRNLRLRPPSLVVIDMSLPTMSGADVIRELRLDGLDKLPVIVVSGSARCATELADAQLWPGAWLVKPLKPRHLVQVVRDFLRVVD